MKGGVGRTTIVANLGVALAREMPGEVLVVDFDARNQLGMHLGLETHNCRGLAHALLTEGSIASVVQTSPDGPDCLPFGRVNERERSQLEALICNAPETLCRALAAPEFSHYRWALVDSAPGPSSWLAPVVLAGDLVLAVLLADAASFATLPQLLGLFDEAGTHRAAGSLHLLVNCGDDGTTLGRDVRALLGAQTHVSVLPMAIHRDEAVREALARQKGIRSHAPTGQATKDLDA